MEDFLARVCLKNGLPIDVKVHLEWYNSDKHGYDFNYSITYNNQLVPESNITKADIERITAMVDKKVAKIN